jgi:hypothetical protein
LAALKAGKSFATNGPLLDFTLNGHGLGDSVSLPAGKHELLARVTLHSNVSVDHLEIVGNGEVVASIRLQGDRTSVSTTVRVAAQRSGWYLLRASGVGPAYPILDVYPYATTGPIYLTVGAEPVRSPDDARYFLAWIDRLRAAVEANQDWNSMQEKTRVLEQIRQARAEFERRK